MVTAKRVRGTAVSMPVGVALGTLCSVMITCVMSALLAWMIMEGKIEESLLGYISMAILLLSSVSGAAISAWKIKRRRMLVCGVTAIAYYLFLLGITALFFGAHYQGAGVTALVIFAGSGSACLLGGGRKRNSTKKFSKYRSR